MTSPLAEFMGSRSAHTPSHANYVGVGEEGFYTLSNDDVQQYTVLRRQAFADAVHRYKALALEDWCDKAPTATDLGIPLYAQKGWVAGVSSPSVELLAYREFLNDFRIGTDSKQCNVRGWDYCAGEYNIPPDYMPLYFYMHCLCYNRGRLDPKRLGVPAVTEVAKGNFFKLFVDMDFKASEWQAFCEAYPIGTVQFRKEFKDLAYAVVSGIADHLPSIEQYVALKSGDDRECRNMHVIYDVLVNSSDAIAYIHAIQRACNEKWPRYTRWNKVVDEQPVRNRNLRPLGAKKVAKDDAAWQVYLPEDIRGPLTPQHMEAYRITLDFELEEEHCRYASGQVTGELREASGAMEYIDGQDGAESRLVSAYVSLLAERRVFGEQVRLDVSRIKKGQYHGVDGGFHYIVRLQSRWCPFKGSEHARNGLFLMVTEHGCRLKCHDDDHTALHLPEGTHGWVPLEGELKTHVTGGKKGGVKRGRAEDDEDGQRQRLEALVEDVTVEEARLWDACEWNEGPTDEMVDLFEKRLCVRGNKTRVTSFDLSDMAYMVVQKVFRSVDAKDKNIYIFRHHEHRYEKIDQSFTDCMRHILMPIIRAFIKRNMEMVVQDRKLLAGIDNTIWRVGEAAIVTAFNGMVAKLHREYGSFEDVRDKDRNLVGFQNCVVVLNEKERMKEEDRHADFKVRYVALSRPGRPEDHVTMRMGVDFIPPTVDLMTRERRKVRQKIVGFLEAIFTSAEVAKYVLRVVAGCLGRPASPKFFVLTGHGSNGKTMFQRLVQSTFGDYYKETSPGILTQKSAHYSSANPTIMGLKNKRVYFVSEPDVVSDEGAKFNEPTIKKLAGGEEWEARDLYQKGTEMVRVEACPFLLCNALPVIVGSDDGIWRRFVFIEMRARFKKGLKKSEETRYLNAADETIQDKIETKWKHEFGSMLVEVYSDMHFHRKGGFCVEENLPAELKEVGASVQRDMCALLTFVSENLEGRNTPNRLAFADVYTAYKRFLAEAGDGRKVDNVRTVKRALQSKSMDVGADGMCKCVWKASSKYNPKNTTGERRPELQATSGCMA